MKFSNNHLKFKGVKDSTSCSHMNCLHGLGVFLAGNGKSSFKDASADDIMDFLANYKWKRVVFGWPGRQNSEAVYNEESLGARTMALRIRCIKLFYRVIYNMKRGSYPPQVENLEYTSNFPVNVTSDELLKPLISGIA